MKVREYKFTDYEEIQSWQHARGLNMPEHGYLSNIGFIVPNIASGFLYTTNSDICHLEMLIANPSVLKEERDKALDLIVETLINKANQLKFKVITSTTQISQIVDRSISHGFIVEDNHKLLIKILSHEE